MIKTQHITTIILSGGKSSRMGVDKGLLHFRDKPMIEYVINAVKDCCSETIIVANKDGYKDFGYAVYPDEIANIGPIGGIYTGLLKSTTDLNLVLTCDSPLVDKALLDNLIASYDDSLDVLYCNYEGNKYPLTAIYSKRILPELKKAINEKDYKVRTLFEKVESRAYNLSKENDYKLSNINTLEDLNKIIQ
jgi:molybdopterin-guanine dinucleotide biosynthesis protein A